MVPFLAHQGGWDELFWFSIPILLVVLWVRWAERRAIRRQDASRMSGGSEKGDPSSSMPDESHT